MANGQSGADNRNSIRLRDYDYTQPGAYFVTICTHERACLLAEIINEKSVLNEYGLIVEDEWYRTAQVRPEVSLDAFVVMPNHIHGIIVIDRYCTGVTEPTTATQRVVPTTRPAGSISRSLGAIIGQFKSIVTKRINAIRQTPGALVWQRNYYEHIIRNEADLDRIRRYIVFNPALWDKDENNPANLK